MTKKDQLKQIKRYKTDSKRHARRCHELWREIVYMRAKYHCEFPNCNRMDLNPHHIFAKGSHPHLKYDPDNGIALCSWHHTLGNEAAHKDIYFKDKITGQRDGYSKVVRSPQFLEVLHRKAQSKYKLDMEMEYRFLEDEKRRLTLRLFDNSANT